jgi:hypothetical protein
MQPHRHTSLNKRYYRDDCRLSCSMQEERSPTPYDEVADAARESFSRARELYELSAEERERVLEDIHGCATIQKETPKFITECLNKFDDEILKIKKRGAYDRVLFLRPGRDLRLMFLRSVSYDALEAAIKMVNFFEDKMQLFGKEKLAKKITLEDLDEDDIEALKTGSLRYLHRKDQSRRAILWVQPREFRYKHWKNQVRTRLITTCLLIPLPILSSH